MKQTGIPIKGVKVKDGKIVRTHKLIAGQRKNLEGKAKTERNAWLKKTK